MTERDQDTDIDGRLTAMVSRAPGRDDPPHLVAGGRRRRIGLSLVAAPILLVAFVATTAAGVLVATNLARGTEGIENPGQPLAGATMECMSPREAAAYLAGHGYTSVVWQVETGDVATKTGGGSVQRSSPPAHGYVIPGSVIDGTLHMVVDQRHGATAVGACFGMPMP